MRPGQADREFDLDEGGRSSRSSRRPRSAAPTAPPSSSWPSTRQGQADTLERKVEICTRAYKILTEEVGFPPEDIIFDPNVFAVATGIEEHDGYGVAFIEATRQIRETLPHAHISGGVSNLSFAVPRQRAGARGDALGLPLPCHPGRHGHGHRQCGPARGLRRDRSRSCASSARTSSSTAATDVDRAAAGRGRALQGRRRRQRAVAGSRPGAS